MINWEFILIAGGDELEIDEPIGWADIAFEIVRDKRNHGVSISYSLNDIKLVGAGAALLKEYYELYGVDAEVQIRITATCGEDVQDEETFKLDFGRYNEACGESCVVTIGIEQTSCFTTFNNNFDKKVDMRSAVAFDGVTPLNDYDGLSREYDIPAKGIALIDEARTDPMSQEDLKLQPLWSDVIAGVVVWPAFQNVVNSSFGSFVTSTFNEAHAWSSLASPPYLSIPAMINTTEILSNVECEFGDPVLDFRVKGHLNISDDINGDLTLYLKVFKLPAGADPSIPGNYVSMYSNLFATIPQGDTEVEFDHAATVPLTLAQGDLLYFYVHADYSFVLDTFIFRLDTESFVKVSVSALCEGSTAELFLIYETISRVAESITNGCLKLESEYYGRVDSEPDAYDEDGCGSLEALTTGLYLRRADNPTFFISMKDLLNNLQCIHNTGFGLMKNDDDEEILKVEKVDFFYQDELLFDCRDADIVNKKVVPEEIPGTIQGGYERWEVQNINGLDEFNSKREFRLTIKNAKVTMDYRCKFVAGGYAIELTRQQSFAETGAADTTYDNETFILCMKRDVEDVYAYPYEYPYYAYYGNDLLVEQGNITDPANLFDPDTVVNFRISPVRNMMRLARLFFGAYRDHADIDSKIILQSGDGNILAEGLIAADLCTPEVEVMAENEEITVEKYQREDDAQPLLRPESITFDYPLSLADFKRIRANPYGYILHSCGGDNEKGHIMKITYKPNAGKASLELRNRYQ